MFFLPQLYVRKLQDTHKPRQQPWQCRITVRPIRDQMQRLSLGIVFTLPKHARLAMGKHHATSELELCFSKDHSLIVSV
jgi:hypothetical protein